MSASEGNCKARIQDILASDCLRKIKIIIYVLLLAAMIANGSTQD